MMTSPFHKGELIVQQRVGEEKIAESVGRLILNKIQIRAVPFLEMRRSVFVSSVDDKGHVWVSVLVGQEGMIEVPDENSVLINLKDLGGVQGDILFENLGSNKDIGLLFIDLATRVRYRINGVAYLNEEAIAVSVEQAYPNCPKYIQRREISMLNRSAERSKNEQGTALNRDIKEWIRNADTFFVGSVNSGGQLDVSHRGGNEGFIEITDAGQLKIPDYKGNSLFNTLGNFVESSRAGLLFIDFETGAVLQLTGESALLFEQDSPEDLIRTGKTGRYWTFKPSKWMMSTGPRIKGQFVDSSPFNPVF